MSVHDHRKLLRPFYEMKADTIQAVQVPSLQFIALEGRCQLNWMGLPEYDGAPIFKLVNQLKRITKTMQGYQFKLMPYEYVWHNQHEDGEWSYTQLMQVPDLVNLDMVEEARRLVEKSYKGQQVAQTRLVAEQGGLCVQKLHQGHFKNAHITFEQLQAYIRDNGYKITGDRKNILVHWCAPEPDKWEMIVRVPVAAEG